MSLREYFNAPTHVQEAFDRQVKREVVEAAKLDQWIAEEVADDPIAQDVGRRRRNDALIADALGLEPEPQTVRVKWDAAWTRRARKPVPINPKWEPYSRDSDPLLLIDLRDVWGKLTGTDPNRVGRGHCPNPEHDDRWPDCAVKESLFNCHACEAGGSIVDLGGYLYGLEPRGFGFHEIRRRLLADLSMEEAA